MLVNAAVLALALLAQSNTPKNNEVLTYVGSADECKGRLTGTTYGGNPPQYGCIVPAVAQSYPPKPGQQPNYPLLVGPAADRYQELLAKESKLEIARAQLRLMVAQLDLMAYRASETLQNSKLIQLSASAADAEKAYQGIVATAIKAAGKSDACQVDLKQEIQCPQSTPKK